MWLLETERFADTQNVLSARLIRDRALLSTDCARCIPRESADRKMGTKQISEGKEGRLGDGEGTNDPRLIRSRIHTPICVNTPAYDEVRYGRGEAKV